MIKNGNTYLLKNCEYFSIFLKCKYVCACSFLHVTHYVQGFDRVTEGVGVRVGGENDNGMKMGVGEGSKLLM
jgi:hypothetical protein